MMAAAYEHQLTSCFSIRSDLGEDVDEYIKNKEKNGGVALSGGCDHSHGNGTAPSIKKVEGSAAKAAVAAGAAVNKNGEIVNGQDGTN